MNTTQPADASAATHEPPATYNVQVLDSLEEFRRCVELQHQVWGDEYEDIVPASLMRASAHVGGLTIGAFDTDGNMLGFVFGVAGIEHGEPVHWSHMLGVHPDVRNRGVGLALKEFQRAQLAASGVRRMYWTFDPLEARNAHLNLNRLGARVVDYVTDMYGASRSPLHHAVATDRLIAECATSPEMRSGGARDGLDVNALPVFTPFPRPGDVLADGAPVTAALIEVPADMQAVVAGTPEAVTRWRTATRDAFLRVLGSGCEVLSLHRQSETGRAFYVVQRKQS